ncbi:MAG: DivIVA domain-containing protein [Clostridia bacterium]|nr:DivIVA domain-containing protein [Clostridia bacterium]
MSMLTPNQIKTQTFPQVSRGAYRAGDVDAFLQRVSYSYGDLMQENNELKNKFAELSDVVKEYNAGKNAIATALVKAQALADQTTEAAKTAAEQVLAEANGKAETPIAEKTAEAERYAAEKKETADRYYEKMHAQMQRIMTEAEAQSKQYADDVNARAAKIIADANEKAAMIVAAAYKDAQDAQQKTDEIIARAKVEMETTKRSIAAFRTDALSVLNELTPMIENISVDEFDDGGLFEKKTSIPEVTPEVGEAPTLSLEALFDLPEDDEPEPAAPEETAQDAAEQAAPADVPEYDDVEEITDDAADSTVRVSDIPPAFDLDKTEALPSLNADQQRSLFDFAAPEPDRQLTFDVPPAEVKTAPAAAEPAPLFTYQTPKEAPKEAPKEDDTPTQSFKFHLTKNFDIFDD